MMRHRVIRPDGATVASTIHPVTGDRDSTPLVFLPGWLCDAQSWEATALRLSAWRTCVTLDLPGFGVSAAGGRDVWSLATFGADIAALVETLPGRCAILVGHSMGGAIALEAAIAAPDCVERIVAVDSFVYPTFYDPTPDDQIEPIVASFAADFSRTVDTAMQTYLLPDSPIDTRYAVDAMKKADVVHGLATLRDFLRWDVQARLAQSTTPISIIAAEAFIAPEAVAYWKSYDLTLVRGVGHFLMLDNPAAFDGALQRVIGEV